MKEKRLTTADTRALARIAKALAHPARIEILRFLAGRANCYCGQIVNELPLAQSTVSQHLAELKAAGLIQGTIDGVKTCYCLEATGVAAAADSLGSFLAGMRQAAASGGQPASTCCPDTPARPRAARPQRPARAR